MEAGIYIDDAGTPGTESPSAFLHIQRKSWAAVIVPEASIVDASYAMDIFLRGVEEDYKAIELHFSDIYGGRGAFDGVPIGERFELIKLMVG